MFLLLILTGIVVIVVRLAATSKLIAQRWLEIHANLKAGSTQSCPGAYVFDPNGYCNISGQALLPRAQLIAQRWPGDSCQPQTPIRRLSWRYGFLILNGYCSNSGQACCESAPQHHHYFTEAGIGTFGNPLTSTPANPGLRNRANTNALIAYFP